MHAFLFTLVCVIITNCAMAPITVSTVSTNQAGDVNLIIFSALCQIAKKKKKEFCYITKDSVQILS